MATDAAEILKRISEGGRRGGSAKVPKGFAKLSKKRRKEIARAGVEARNGNGKNDAV